MQTNTTYRVKDGKWQLIVSWKDTNGKWRQRSKQGFDTKKAAKQYEHTLLEQIKNRPEPIDRALAGITLSAFTEEYLLNRTDIAYSTKHHYRLAVKSLGKLGDMPVNKITYLLLQSAIREWKIRPLTQRNYKSKLDVLFRAAVKPYRIISYSPMEDINIGRERRKRTISTISEPVFRKAVRSTRRADTRLALLIGWYTGMRKGEIVALRWQDISFQDESVTVSRQLIRSEHGQAVADITKSANGFRTVPAPPELIRELKQYRAAYPVQINGQLFAYPSGIYADMNRVMEKHGCHPHQLRHTYATRLLAQGMDVQTVAALLGDNVNTVIGTYIHYTDEMRKAAAQNIRKIFSVNF